jgi:hypothetical protein
MYTEVRYKIQKRYTLKRLKDCIRIRFFFVKVKITVQERLNSHLGFISLLFKKTFMPRSHKPVKNEVWQSRPTRIAASAVHCSFDTKNMLVKIVDC